jgi:hypothetical protein
MSAWPAFLLALSLGLAVRLAFALWVLRRTYAEMDDES